MAWGHDFQFVRHLLIVACFSQGPKMRRLEDFSEQRFVRIDPRNGRQAASGAENALRQVFFEDNGQQTREQTLKEVEDVVYGRAYFADGFEDVAVEDHLPLYPPFGSKEGCRMDGEVKFEFRASREVDGRAPNGGCFQRKKHAMVLGWNVCPLVLANELVPETLEPTVCFCIRSTQGVGGGQGYAGATSPVVHVGDIAGKDDLCPWLELRCHYALCGSEQRSGGRC